VLCEAVGVNRRHLQRAFHAVYALSPIHYLKLRRLHLARRTLRRAAQPTTVTEIALSLGFRDLGRFASAYSRLFGEPPSTTLARARGSPGPAHHPDGDGSVPDPGVSRST
jgi:AraC-like DNA-binding protein